MAVDPKKANKNEKTADEESQTTGQSKKKLFIMVGIAILLMAVSIGGTLVAVKVFSAEETAEEIVEEEELALPAIYYTMQPNFTVNFNVNGRQRYLQAELTLLYRNPEVQALLDLHMPAIRNQLVMLLSGKSFDELQNPDSREKLKEESLAAVQSILDKERAALIEKTKKEDDKDEKEKKPALAIEQVLFTRFVMQ